MTYGDYVFWITLLLIAGMAGYFIGVYKTEMHWADNFLKWKEKGEK